MLAHPSARADDGAEAQPFGSAFDRAFGESSVERSRRGLTTKPFGYSSAIHQVCTYLLNLPSAAMVLRIRELVLHNPGDMLRHFIRELEEGRELPT